MNEVATKKENAVLPFDVSELQKDAKLGGEVSARDISIPYLYILQPMSPQCNIDSPKYIQGATPSMFYLTALEKVYNGRDDGLTVVPCYYERLITEWIDRDAGGGLVASHPTDTPLLAQAKPDDKGRPTLPNGHKLVETAYHYVLVQDPGTGVWHQAIMPMKSTFLKASRKLNNQIVTTMIPGTQTVAPRFLFKYNVKTLKEQKDQNIWSVPVFTQLDMVTKEIYTAAKSYAEIASSGQMRQNVVAGDQQAQQELPF
jgi:hypothetical protein